MNIGIVGLGLIGGSLGLDLRSLGHRVLGVSRSPQTCTQAIARSIVDEASVDLSLLTGADLVFICTPLMAIVPTVEQLIPFLSPQTILTDVGSVKTPLVQAITPLWSNFVGGHPMAGLSESGLDAAQSHLFVHAPYVTTPVPSTPALALTIVEELVGSLQARVYRCSPENHDRAVAWISHLPVMISASLIAAAMSENDAAILSLAQSLASSGFRDTSRVGGGNPELGVMMAQFNRTSLLLSLQSYRDRLDQFITQIEEENWPDLAQQLIATQRARPDFIQKNSLVP